jgi:cyclopropane fatty-acyl-phospholipid synthase-like methyltransferase
MGTSDPTHEGSHSPAPSSAAAHITHETYTHGHAAATLRQHGRRTAEEAAAFLLPELKAGMRLLDVGCGPGSITRGLAERLAPGEVIGIDLAKEALASARTPPSAGSAISATWRAACTSCRSPMPRSMWCLRIRCCNT